MQLPSVISRNRILALVLFAFLLSLPHNLFFKLDESLAYTHGVFVDYRIPKLYVSDVLGVALVGLLTAIHWNSLVKHRNSVIRRSAVVAVILILLIAVQFFTQKWLVGTFGILRIAVSISFGLAGIVAVKTLKSPLVLVYALSTLLILHTGLALYQFSAQQPLLPYRFLGESNLLAGTHIPSIVWQGREYLLPSAATPHPNILAGFICLVVTGISWLFHSKKGLIISIIVGCIALLLTNSLLAVLGLCLLIFSLLVAQSKNIKIYQLATLVAFLFISISSSVVVLQTMTHHPSVTRRVELYQSAVSYLVHHPLQGTGVAQSTDAVVFNYSRDFVRFIQPPHNIGMVAVLELGIAGTVLLGGLAYWLIQLLKPTKKLLYTFLLALLPLLPLLALDHYLWTYPPITTLTVVVVGSVVLYGECWWRNHG